MANMLWGGSEIHQGYVELTERPRRIHSQRCAGLAKGIAKGNAHGVLSLPSGQLGMLK